MATIRRTTVTKETITISNKKPSRKKKPKSDPGVTDHPLFGKVTKY